MRTNIRKATLNDLNDILRLNYLLFKEAYRYDKTLNMKWIYSKEGRDFYRERITKPDGCALVAELEGTTVGYLVGSLKGAFYRVKAKYAELDDMLVLERFREQGIGGMLLEEFISWCKRKNVSYISVIVLVKNQLGIKFYKKFGFKEYELTLEKALS